MCGIVAFISSYSNGFGVNEAKAFRDMLVFDTVRGFDSTGVFGVDNDGNVGILKKAVTGGEFVKTIEYDAFDTDAVRRGMFLVGHNRAATRGTVNDKNAHPFWVDDKIVLVQNGTYKGDHTHHKDTEVDTEAIAHVLAEESDIEKALQKVDAAYAFIWYDVVNKTLNIIRNDERPLFYVETKAGGVMIASEKQIITLAADRNNIELKSEPYQLRTHHLVQFKIDNRTWEFSSRDIDAEFKGSRQYHGGFRQYNYSDACAYGVYDYPRDLGNFSKRYDHAMRAVGEQSYNQINNKSSTRDIATVLMNAPKYANLSVTEDERDTILGDLVLRDKNKEVVVELLDYEPANGYVNCRTWFLIGTVLTTDESPSPVIYTMLYDVDEVEALDFVAKQFYRTKLDSTPVSHNIPGPAPRKSFITMYRSKGDYTAIKVPTVTDEVNNNGVH